jgi:hypothetical protein
MPADLGKPGCLLATPRLRHAGHTPSSPKGPQTPDRTFQPTGGLPAPGRHSDPRAGDRVKGAYGAGYAGRCAPLDPAAHSRKTGSYPEQEAQSGAPPKRQADPAPPQIAPLATAARYR